MLFADDAALAAHSEGTLQSLIYRAYKACNFFSLAVILTKSFTKGLQSHPTSVSNTTNLRLLTNVPK